jgi:hypothetical protein
MRKMMFGNEQEKEGAYALLQDLFDEIAKTVVT